MSGRTIKATLTPPQGKFFGLQCKYPAFVGGFGTGKTETMAVSAFRDASHSSNALIAMYEPTYDLIRLILAPRMEDKLSEYGVRYKYNKSENIIYTATSGIGDFVLRTLDNPARIVGYESYRAHIDEIDTLKEQHANDVWIKVIARNRQRPFGVEKPFNRVSVYTTPEGFRFVYKTWKRNPKDGYQMVQASTCSNPFLPDDYADSLKASYPPQLIDAYLDGEFVNLTSGTVYHCYDRKENGSTETVIGNEPIFVGMDFNVGKMAAIIHVKRSGLPHAVDEIIDGYDTPDVIKTLQNRYSENKIHIYPDASGNSRKSVNASETDIALLKRAGLAVHVNGTNPSVKDRVNSMNAMFLNAEGERRYFVNADRCPNYTESLEQQIWSPSGEPDKTAGFDHTNDAGGYYISFEYPIVRTDLTKKINFNWN
ncbi:terminase large subunit domain-containing protein [Xenorhabdus ehlersii]|uniref:Terminase n=1 Tax=Xenorhabdus ehlersii TaxID=290111 RepID=A0A2D0IKC5_9GAMM|nr:terminase family protein [Xenorhabdus ehlersii]PHM22226.1 terminase [Xenorhabdus ehlersii]RKE90570.1 terminase family protein [Xenorhabdus ehlersii]